MILRLSSVLKALHMSASKLNRAVRYLPVPLPLLLQPLSLMPFASGLYLNRAYSSPPFNWICSFDLNNKKEFWATIIWKPLSLFSQTITNKTNYKELQCLI
uniref:Uncharacterized protein n=1 Tax=uncultured marine virus TaxID=186617 RepID=A0A0F7L695_9VIRU|nr:hypothetical protein [uncultured marine virus]